MFDRVADLTWKHPKLVLAAVAAFAVFAAAFGHDVERHLKNAGFTDPASESERAKSVLTDALGYDANPGIFLVVRAPGGGPLDVRDPAVRPASTASPPASLASQASAGSSTRCGTVAPVPR